MDLGKWKLFWLGYQPHKPVDEMSADEIEVTLLLMAAHRPLVPMMLVALGVGLSPFLIPWALGGDDVLARAMEKIPGGEWFAANYSYVALFLAVTSMLVVLPLAVERYKIRRYLQRRGVRF